MKINKKTFYLIIIFILFSIFFFSFLPVVTPDSSTYYDYVQILKGKSSFSSWSPVRGPSMPLILFIIDSISNTPISFLIFSYILYIIFFIFSYKLFKEIFIKRNYYFYKILFFLFIAFNVLNIGYYHVMLTEFIAITISSISCYLSYKMTDNEFFLCKTKVLLYVCIFSLLMIFTWFLKQNYITAVFLPLLIAIIISIFKKGKSRFEFFSKILFITVPIFLLYLSINTWNSFLLNSGASSPSDKSTSFLNSSLINGLTSYRKIADENKYTYSYLSNNKYINKTELKLIENILSKKSKYNDFILFEVKDLSTNRTEDIVLLPHKNNDYIDTKESIAFIFTAIKENPLLVLDSYYSNYLATINVFISYTPDWKLYYPIKKTDDFYSENKSLGLATYDDRAIYWWAWSEKGKDYSDNMENYEINNYPNKKIQYIAKTKSIIDLEIFEISFIFAPFVFLFSLIRIFKLRKNNRIKENTNPTPEEMLIIRKYELLIILFGYAFFHVLANALLGAIIDRYASIAYPSAVFGMIILISIIFSKIKYNNLAIIKKGDLKMKKKLNSNKTIIIIPAYNESKNIVKVLDEIAKDCPMYDVVVINDCSKDNTAELIASKKIRLINHPFNMGYAKSVQTGIKFAKENGYDYVIQFDADGQHIAKEAQKLVEEIKKTNADIIIGSRFINVSDYKHNFFRKIGTKVFSLIIKLISKRKITDPTSGFQCLNRKVIEKYSQIGNYPEFPDANLILDMLLDGYEILEIPVKMRQREDGESMHGGIIKPIKYMIKMFYSLFIISLKKISLVRRTK